MDVSPWKAVNTHFCWWESLEDCLYLLFLFFSLLLKKYLNWRIIALQCCADFCHTTMWISHNYIYVCVCVCMCIYIITSLLSLAPNPPPSLPSRSSQEPGWAPGVTKQFPTSRFTHGSVCMSVLLSQFIPSSPSPHCVHKSVLYVCVSNPSLQIGSSVPFF